MSLKTSDTANEAGLNRSLGIAGNIAITLSGITPAASVFVIVPALLGITGTGIIWSFILALIVALGIGLCDAELGSLYPMAGGSYSLVSKVLGRYLGFMAIADIVVQAVFLPASIALGDGLYLNSFFPSVDASVIGFLVMIVTSAIAILPISANGYVTGIFLVLELVVLVVISIFGFSHMHHSLHTVFGSPLGLANGHLSPLGGGVLLAGVVTALFAFNGYDSAIVFSEETKGKGRAIAYAVLIALVITVITEVVPILSVVIGAPSIPELLGSSNPITYMITAVMGSHWNTVIIIGVMLAIFNATIAINLNFGRIIYSTARDGAWPTPINRLLKKLHPKWQTPWVATLAVGIVGGVLCFASKFILLVTFTAVLIVIMYGLVAIAALVSRFRNSEKSPFRMPLWPVPPVIALVGIVIALTQQTHQDLFTALIIFVVATIYYLLYFRRKHVNKVESADEPLTMD